MRKIEVHDTESKSAELITENISALAALFPEAVSEDSVDMEALRELLGGGGISETSAEEKYGLTWNGKQMARRLALTPSTSTLRPVQDESFMWEETKNIMVEGENLEVLKLLQKSYSGKVKLIYIDPPYNTGNDFIYQDSYTDSIENYLSQTGQLDNNMQRLSSNLESSGRFHTRWLNMMYPRLKLARNLMTKDGAIFVSCDEVEQPRLRLVMDEIFGQENFVADMVWAAGRKNDSRLISISHEYIICYVKDAGALAEQKVEWHQRRKGLDEIYAVYHRFTKQYGNDYRRISSALKQWYNELRPNHPARDHKHYCYADSRGIYFAADLSWPGGGGPKYEVINPSTGQPVRVPSRGWIFSDPEKMDQYIQDDRIHFGDNNGVPCQKIYLREREYSAPYSVFYQDGRAATKRLRELMNGTVFDFPKDETMIQSIIEMTTSSDDIIMDFFAGSGTTGHAVMAQNMVDNGQRRFILVQLAEPLNPKSKRYSNVRGYCEEHGLAHNIATLTRERLRRSATNIAKSLSSQKLDLGFRTFRLDSSNIRAWDAQGDDLEQDLYDNIDHLKEGRSEQDILFEILLKLGLDLCAPMQCVVAADKNVYSVGAGTLIACIDRIIALDDVEGLASAIALWHEELDPTGEATVLFLDSAFEDDVAKANLVAILQQRGLHNIRSI